MFGDKLESIVQQRTTTYWNGENSIFAGLTTGSETSIAPSPLDKSVTREDRTPEALEGENHVHSLDISNINQ